jgi:hypothetical protein
MDVQQISAEGKITQNDEYKFVMNEFALEISYCKKFAEN